MKRIFTLCIILLCTALTSSAQEDSTKVKKEERYDTLRIGGMVIIRDRDAKTRRIDRDTLPRMRYGRNRDKKSNFSTNWLILDIGFSSYTDNTIYGSPGAEAYAPGSNKTWFDLKDGKSRNVNFWFFMQKINIAKHVLNFKYGVGLELNNYHYKAPIRYTEPGNAIPDPPRVILDNTPNRSYKKNKLAADYLTVPLMLNVNFTPNRRRGFGFSAGISAGYLYSARNKTVTSDEGKEKTKDDFELQRFKLSYVAELSLGPVRFYGSYALKNMYERGLDIRPYNFGFRFSNW